MKPHLFAIYARSGFYARWFFRQAYSADVAAFFFSRDWPGFQVIQISETDATITQP
jgi:hypothetical protein